MKFSSVKKWQDKEEAAALYYKVKAKMCATVTKVEKKEKVENPPLLYDLTTLQKEANTKHGFTAEQTLELVQKLYEAKLVTYPRTSSRHIPEDVFAEIPLLFERLAGHSALAEKIGELGELNRRCVDASKVTARHALLERGNGTPATRAAIIETLLRREYMVRVKKSLGPTEKGLALYSIVKDMDIADVEMTGQWEAELADIEKGKTSHAV